MGQSEPGGSFRGVAQGGREMGLDTNWRVGEGKRVQNLNGVEGNGPGPKGRGAGRKLDAGLCPCSPIIPDRQFASAMIKIAKQSAMCHLASCLICNLNAVCVIIDIFTISI